MRQKRGQRCPGKCRFDSAVFPADRPCPSDCFWTGRWAPPFLSFFPLFYFSLSTDYLGIHPTQCEALGRIARSLAAGRKGPERY